ncbi:MAG: mechanosensitive ion channel domain-containing protein [Ginsengibacter sp.]
MMKDFKIWIEKILSRYSVLDSLLPYITMLILLALTLVVIYLCLVVTRWILRKFVRGVVRKTPTKWDDLLIKHKFFRALAFLVAVIILNAAIPIIFQDFPERITLIQKFVDIYFLFVIIKIVVTFLKGSEEYLSESELFVEKPLASYFQLGRILLYIGGFVLALSILLGKSPLYFIGAFGAMTAVLLLVFKDTILGLVASIQISANDMIRVGDWVEMPKYNADGDVVAINMNTVKIINWDKTITTVPTHYFITDSFKNWRGMQESGGRRIKRTLYINMATIRFVDAKLREHFLKYDLISDYISERQSQIELYNQKHNVDTSALINGRRMTNIGVFRNYINAYLLRHPGINQDMTLLVRQMESTQFGVPIEIYCFTSSVKWADYEGAQSDIFDHLFAAAGHFDLEIFQSPSGADISNSTNRLVKAIDQNEKISS